MQVKNNRSIKLQEPQWFSSCSHGMGGYRQLCHFFTLMWNKCSVSFAPSDKSAELTGAGPCPELLRCFSPSLADIANKINPRDRHRSPSIPPAFQMITISYFPYGFQPEDSQSTEQNLLVLLSPPEGISSPHSEMSWFRVRSKSLTVESSATRDECSIPHLPKQKPKGYPSKLFGYNVISHLHTRPMLMILFPHAMSNNILGSGIWG